MTTAQQSDATAKKDETLLQKPDVFTPNFHSKYSVVLDHPMSTVYPMLAYGDTLEKSVRLSELCTDFELLKRDMVEKKDVRTSHFRTLPSAPEGTGLPRQFFRLQETVPLAFGLIKNKVEITGTLTWDEDAKLALYESSANQSILVWKFREFEEVDEGGKKKTRVTETIKGHSPALLKMIVQRETASSHKAHMDKYHTLF